MDEKFRKLQRAYEANPDDSGTAKEYVLALERRLGIKEPTKEKVKNTDEFFPCVLCEKPIPQEATGRDGPSFPWLEMVEINGRPRIRTNNPWQGVIVSTGGNYGSQVLDGHTVYFYICDECIVRNSHKMLHYDWSHNDISDERGHTIEKLENARDYYERWFKAIQERRTDPDEYLDAVEPYFR